MAETVYPTPIPETLSTGDSATPSASEDKDISYDRASCLQIDPTRRQGPDIDDGGSLPVTVMLDRTRYQSKEDAQRDIAGISLRLCGKAETVTLEELAELLGSGASFCPAVMEGGRKNENWRAQQLFVLDFDGGLTLEGFLLRCEDLGLTPAIVYYTFRHTPNAHKFRAIFVNDTALTDPHLRDKCQRYLMDCFPEGDAHTGDRARLFLGTDKEAPHLIFDARVDLPAKLPVELQTESERSGKSIRILPPPFVTEAVQMLVPYWVSPHRHKTAMALSGLLIRAGWDDERILSLVSEICRAAKDDELDNRLSAVSATREAIESGGSATGGITLSEIIGDKAVFDRICRCLGVNVGTKSAKGRSQPLEFRKRLTELGNAEKFAHLNADRITFVVSADANEWRYWDGVRWVGDARNRASQLAIETLEALEKEAQSMDVGEQGALLLDHVLKSRSSGGIKHMLELARYLSKVGSDSSEFNRHPHLINHPNGVLDLRTLLLSEHDPALRITKCARTPYIDEGPEPARWIETLNLAFDGNAELIAWFGKALARSFLLGENRDQFYICYGTGANGKTTIFEALRMVFGPDYITTAEPDTFMLDNDISRNALARLQGVKLVVGSEAKDGALFNEALMKKVTSGEEIEAKYLYKNVFTYAPEFTVFFLTNHKPIIRGTDYGIWRRARLVPFTVRIPEDRQDPHMLSKLIHEEAEGIVRWVYQHLRAYQEDGMGEVPRVVVEATAEYQAESNIVKTFLDECCLPDDTATTSLQSMFRAYKKFREASGYRQVSNKSLKADFERMGVQMVRKSSGYSVLGYAVNAHAESLCPDDGSAMFI